MLCPICSLQSDTSSVVCSKHVSITYDVTGRVISYRDYPYQPYQDYLDKIKIFKYDDEGKFIKEL